MIKGKKYENVDWFSCKGDLNVTLIIENIIGVIYYHYVYVYLDMDIDATNMNSSIEVKMEKQMVKNRQILRICFWNKIDTLHKSRGILQLSWLLISYLSFM